MGVGQIAGLIAAIAFAVLAGFMIYPLIRLGKLFDQIADTVRESGEHAIPALDEGVTTVKQVNKSLEDVNKISAAASTTEAAADSDLAYIQGKGKMTIGYTVPRQARHQDRVVLLCAEIHRAVVRRQEEHRP